MNGMAKAVTLEELVEAAEAHWALIQTGRGEYSLHFEDTSENTPGVVKYQGVWMLKDGGIALRYKGTRDGAWYPANNRGPSDGEYEVTDQRIQIMLHTAGELAGLAMIDKMHENSFTFREFAFPGIFSASYHLSPLRGIPVAVQERGLIAEITGAEEGGLIRILIHRENPPGKGMIILDPQKQYSVLEEWYDFTGEPPQLVQGKVEMEYIEPAGIWFPRRALLERYEGKPLVKTGTKPFEFTNTQLNIPIPDEEFHIKLPTGTRLTDTFAQ